MNANDFKRGVQIAGAIATVLGGAACASEETDVGPAEALLECIGGNSCKGMSHCAGGPGGSSCEGMNACKGMGWSYAVDADDCVSMGGKLAAEATVKCLGGNSCKGMSNCMGGPSGNSCMGMNDCKGMGWSYTETDDECTAAGGTVAS